LLLLFKRGKKERKIEDVGAEDSERVGNAKLLQSSAETSAAKSQMHRRYYKRRV